MWGNRRQWLTPGLECLLVICSANTSCQPAGVLPGLPVHIGNAQVRGRHAERAVRHGAAGAAAHQRADQGRHVQEQGGGLVGDVWPGLLENILVLSCNRGSWSICACCVALVPAISNLSLPLITKTLPRVPICAHMLMSRPHTPCANASPSSACMHNTHTSAGST